MTALSTRARRLTMTEWATACFGGPLELENLRRSLCSAVDRPGGIVLCGRLLPCEEHDGVSEAAEEIRRDGSH